MGVTWSGKTTPLPKHPPQSGHRRGQSSNVWGRDHGCMPATTRYNRWETLQDVTRVLEHHNHCSGSRTAVCDQGTPLHMDCY